MSSPAEQLKILLQTEHQAAIRADLGALIEIQDQKRAVIDALGSTGVPDDLARALSHQAEQNLALMRNLARCLLGIVTDVDNATYAANGAAQNEPRSAIRGAL